MGSSAYATEAPKTVTPETVAIGVQVDGSTIGTVDVAVNATVETVTTAARSAYPAIPEGATAEYKDGKLINFTRAPATETTSA